MCKNGNIVINNVILRQEVIDTKFACNLDKCKGACCTIESDFGAPLLEDEVVRIHESLSAVKDYLSETHLNKLAKDGFWEKKNGELLVNSINRKDCIFTFFENGIAKCALEQAFLDGKTDFRKPLSCHLFPIRVIKFGGDILRYEEFSECSPAIERGKKENISLIDFCKTALERLYNKSWYSQLKEMIGK